MLPTQRYPEKLTSFNPAEMFQTTGMENGGRSVSRAKLKAPCLHAATRAPARSKARDSFSLGVVECVPTTPPGPAPQGCPARLFPRRACSSRWSMRFRPAECGGGARVEPMFRRRERVRQQAPAQPWITIEPLPKKIVPHLQHLYSAGAEQAAEVWPPRSRSAGDGRSLAQGTARVECQRFARCCANARSSRAGRTLEARFEKC